MASVNLELDITKLKLNVNVTWKSQPVSSVEKRYICRKEVSVLRMNEEIHSISLASSSETITLFE